jgi:hypothetical protein
VLDTRLKILSAEQALAALKGCCAFVAYFDILTVDLIRRIAEVGRPVVAVVLDPARTVLSARTRAELAAALASVQAVVPISEDLTGFLKALEPDKIIHWEQEDAQRTAALIEHVRAIHIAE